MSTEVVLTGTGYPRPHPRRAGPGVLVRSAGLNLQFDAGRATAMRLAALGVSCRDLDALFLTHHHSDHLSGLADIALSRWIALDREAPDTPLPVIAPSGPASGFAEALLAPWAQDIAVRRAQTGRESRPAVLCGGFDATEHPAVVWANAGVEVSAVRVHHEPVEPAVAFRVDTPDGAVVVSGDTRVCDEVWRLADGASVLVHEAAMPSRLSGGRSEGILGYHADPRALGALLAPEHVPVLLLTHLIPAPDTPEERQAFADEVRAGGYRGEVIVGDDLARVGL